MRLSGRERERWSGRKEMKRDSERDRGEQGIGEDERKGQRNEQGWAGKGGEPAGLAQ
jgi:hypothetical protein